MKVLKKQEADTSFPWGCAMPPAFRYPWFRIVSQWFRMKILLFGLFCSVLQWFDIFLINVEQEEGAERYGENLSNRVGIPYIGKSTNLGHNKCNRKQYDELTDDRCPKAHHAMTKGLEHGGAYDTKSGEQEAEGNGFQGRYTNF